MSTAQFSATNTDSVFEDPDSMFFVEVLFTEAVPWSTRENPRPEGGYSLSYAIELNGTASRADFQGTSNTVVLPSGSDRILLPISIVDDTEQEIDETFNFSLVESNFVNVFPDDFLMIIFDNDRSISDDDPSNPILEENSLNHENLEVHRFFNMESGRHFYTAIEEEAEFVLSNFDSFVLEKDSSFFSASASEWEASAIHRFFNQDTGVHFYTISDEERDFLINNLEQFAFEGTGFYAWENETAPINSSEVYRFFNPTTGSHFFALSDEAEFVRQNLPEFIDEGVAFNVFEDAGQSGFWGDIEVQSASLSPSDQFGEFDVQIGFSRTGNMNIPVSGEVNVIVSLISRSGAIISESSATLPIDSSSGSQTIDYDVNLDVNPLNVDRVEITTYIDLAEPYTSFNNEFTEIIPISLQFPPDLGGIIDLNLM